VAELAPAERVAPGEGDEEVVEPEVGDGEGEGDGGEGGGDGDEGGGDEGGGGV
jgi:hypothetical protein